MLFSSLTFLYGFLPAVLMAYFLVPGAWKNGVLLLASLLFYAWGGPKYVLLMIGSILLFYLCGLAMGRAKSEKGRRSFLLLAIAAGVGLLSVFKYADFFIGSFNAAVGTSIPLLRLALPIGISFYTFQCMSYAVDVYRGKARPQKNLITFGAYVALFPQLIAGPIVRYADVEGQLAERKVTLTKFGEGTAWFLRGLAKKVLLANNIGMLFDAVQAMGAGNISMLTAWLGCAAYTFQIYFDFSGYSDMAIGLGKMFGFTFMKNFDYPYTSSSITEFWRRWHISLGTWFREYVYIPLGGNRVSIKRNILNICIVWMLTGLWHGAAWNFIFWGVYYGALLLLEKFVLKDVLAKTPGTVKHIYTMILVMIGWVFFFSPTLGSAFQYVGAMFGIGATGIIDRTAVYYLSNYFILFLLMILCSVPYTYKRFRRLAVRGNVGRVVMLAVYVVLFILSTAYLVNATYNPFLYFRF